MRDMAATPLLNQSTDNSEGKGMADIHNVFVSHRHEDDSLVDELMGILRRGRAQIRDSSIHSADANTADSLESIKQFLACRIKRAGTIFVIVSHDTKNHGWVDWEVEY